MYLNGNPIRLIHETVSRFSRGPRGIVRVPVIKGDWASSEGRLVLGFVLIVVSGARFTRCLAGLSVADRVVRMVGRRIVFAGLGVGPGPIVTLGVVELVAARFAPGRIRGVRGPGRVQDGSRSRGRDEDDGEDAQQGIYQFDASYKGHRDPGDSLSCTVIEMITAPRNEFNVGGPWARAMDDWEDPVSDRSFRTALLEALDGRPPPVRRGPEGLLWIASALLLGTNLLLVLAVFVNVIGGLGPVNPSRILWAALGMDLVGVGVLGWIVWDNAGRVEGPARLIRRIAALLLFLWVGLTGFWRFALPAAVGTDIQELFTAFLTGPSDFPTRFRQDLTAMYQIFGLWIAAAAVFVAAHVLLAIVRRTAGADDWARGLPVYAWILAAGISLVGTVFIVLSFLYVLAGRPLADDFHAWLVSKVIVAPNVFLSGYASSLDLGRRIRAARTRRP